LSDISWGGGGYGHDEAVAVLRVWLVSSASEGLQENPYFLLFALKSLREDCSCLTDLPPIL
jgi:hypothetical protein